MTDQPGPTARQRLIRTGLSHAFADLVLDQHAHQLAEQQRRHFGVGDAPAVRAHCDPDCGFCQGVTSAADLIDPEAKP
jgi:hypothetical protein